MQFQSSFPILIAHRDVGALADLERIIAGEAGTTVSSGVSGIVLAR